ncbi:hypothetical protein ATO49_12665 [Mycolicibacterium fortuitum subsp. fortuitum DSM 46621 = ATCC 6841 = JCM 6387]|nr:hypothetical protein ATO49_12665 [Mycolicibacterium fortuitum subsp. fortuitum DSM 46621 = ATCC 6841 = JCM 6387]
MRTGLWDARTTARWNSVSDWVNCAWSVVSVCARWARGGGATRSSSVRATAARRAPSSLEAAPDLQHVTEFGTAQSAQRRRYLAGGPHVGAVALPDLEDAVVRQRPDGLADGVAADAECLDQFRLGGGCGCRPATRPR